MVTLGHLWYNSSPHVVGSPSAAQSGTTNYQDVQDYPTLGLMFGFPAHPYYHLECTLLQSGAQPELSYSASRSERVIRLAM